MNCWIIRLICELVKPNIYMAECFSQKYCVSWAYKRWKPIVQTFPNSSTSYPSTKSFLFILCLFLGFLFAHKCLPYTDYIPKSHVLQVHGEELGAIFQCLKDPDGTDHLQSRYFRGKARDLFPESLLLRVRETYSILTHSLKSICFLY